LRDAEPFPFRRVHIASLAADEGFVNFDFAAELFPRVRPRRRGPTCFGVNLTR